MKSGIIFFSCYDGMNRGYHGCFYAKRPQYMINKRSRRRFPICTGNSDDNKLFPWETESEN